MPTDDFTASARRNLDNMVQDALKDVDYLFIGDLHTKTTTIAFVARPDVMRAFAQGGVTDLDLEMIPPEVVQVAALYHDDQISKETMEFFVTDVFAAESRFKDEIETKMKDIASIIDQAKTLNIEISSSNHMFPELSEEEYQIKYAHAVPLIEYQARAIDKIVGFSELDQREKVLHYHRTRREFNESNPKLYEQSLRVEGMQKERGEALLERAKAEMEKLSTTSAQSEMEKFLVKIGEQDGHFTQDDFNSLSTEAQGLTRQLFSYSAIRRRFENDPVAAQDIQEARNEGGKLVSVYGALHFDRVTGDIDASISDGKVATMRIYDDTGEDASTLKHEYDRVQALHGYDTSQVPDVTIDMSKGTWIDASGQKTQIDMTPPSEGVVPSVEHALPTQLSASGIGMGAKQ